MENKFTPGPWKVLDDQGGGYADRLAKCAFSVEADGGMHLAVIIGDMVREHEANARLIAAAPTLYDALKFAVSVLNTAGIAGSIYAPVLQQAREALKLANGQDTSKQ